MYSVHYTFKQPMNRAPDPKVRSKVHRLQRWVSPFGNHRIKGCSRLPGAYRSVPRPSSPLNAKASTRSPYALDRSQQNSCMCFRRPYASQGDSSFGACMRFVIFVRQYLMSSQAQPGQHWVVYGWTLHSRCQSARPPDGEPAKS